MDDSLQQTIQFNLENLEDLDKELLEKQPRAILYRVYQALREKGYDPINQVVGYIISGDPTYITSHNNARNLIRNLERDELLEEVFTYYVEHCLGGNQE